MIGHRAPNLPYNIPLYRKNRTKFEPLGVMVNREKASFGSRLTIRRPDGSEFVMAMASASKLWYDENAKPKSEAEDDVARIATWMEEQALLLSSQAEVFHAGTDDESFYEDLAKHVTEMADAVRSGRWQVETV